MDAASQPGAEPALADARLGKDAPPRTFHSSERRAVPRLFVALEKTPA